MIINCSKAIMLSIAAADNHQGRGRKNTTTQISECYSDRMKQEIFYLASR